MFFRGHFTAIEFRHSQNFFKKLLAPARGIAYINNPQADMAQLVEHNLAKVGVAGSSPVVRSIAFPDRLGGPFSAKWPSGKAEACKAFTPGSNPGFASRSSKGPSFPEGPFSLRGTGFGPHWRRGAEETRSVFQRSAQGAARATASAGGAAARGTPGRTPVAPAAGVLGGAPRADPGAFPNEAENPI